MRDDWDAYLRSEYSKTVEVSCKACDKKFMVPAMINTYSACANFCSKECEEVVRVVKSKDEIIEKLAEVALNWINVAIWNGDVSAEERRKIEDIKKGIF